MSSTQDFTRPRGRLNTITKSDALQEGYVKTKSKTNNKWKTRYVTLVEGGSKKPCLLLMFKGSDKEKLKTYAEVHGVSVKSNADDIRVDDVGNQILIRTFTTKSHINWTAALKHAITKRVHFPVKHHGLDDDEYSLLHIKESEYSDHSHHQLIVLHSPYEDTLIRHCWDSLEIKQLRTLQEGIFLEFCPHCSKSVNFVKLGFTLRLPQNEIDEFLEYFCKNTTAKRKKDEPYIYEMISHFNQCSHSPPVHPPPDAPSVPTNMHLTLYNVSDVLFKDKKPSCSRASKSKLVQEAEDIPEPQRELHYMNQDSRNRVAMTNYETGLSSATPQRKLHYMNQGPKNGAGVKTVETDLAGAMPQRESQYMNHESGTGVAVTTALSTGEVPQRELHYMNQQDINNQVATNIIETSSLNAAPQRESQYANQDFINQPVMSTFETSEKQSQSHFSGNHVNNCPPVAPRRKVNVSESHQKTVQVMEERSAGKNQRDAPIPKPRRGRIVERTYDDIDSPSKQNSRSNKFPCTNVAQAASTTAPRNERIPEKPAVQKTRLPSETAQSKPKAASYLGELKAKLTSGPDVVPIPLTESKKPPMSISVYRKKVMDKKPSYCETSSSATFPQKTTANNGKSINLLQRTVFFQHT